MNVIDVLALLVGYFLLLFVVVALVSGAVEDWWLVIRDAVAGAASRAKHLLRSSS